MPRGVYIRSEEYKATISRTLLGNNNASGKHRPISDEARANLSQALKGNKNTPIGNKHALGHEVTEEGKQRISDAHKGNTYSLGRHMSSETRKKISLALSNPSKLVRRKMSRRQKRKWKESDYIVMQMRARHTKPNKVELVLASWLEQTYPNEWAYNGDGRLGFVIGGRVPDFVNVNGKKAVIELFGNYWHKKNEEDLKIEHYAKFGYNCLIIWEDECGDLNKLKERVLRLG